MAFRLRWPTEFGVITQKFGEHPENYKRFGLPGHEGIDFRAPNGSKVFACADGVVADVRLDGDKDRLKFPYGNQVRLFHDTPEGQFTTVYAHLEAATVAIGAPVKAGQQIGIADTTGNADGAHLHLSLKKKGATAAGQTGYPNDIIDPTPYLDPFGTTPVVNPILVDDLDFVADLTIPDNSLKNMGEQFVKTWSIRNAGTTTWGAGYTLAFFKDEQMGAPNNLALPPAKPGETVTMSVPLTAPLVPGLHRSTWKARNPSGVLFGSPLFALIKVPASQSDQPLNGVIDLSHYNVIQDLAAAKAAGIVAIVHKATQGLGYVDPTYADRKAQAQALGLLWGAYHFGEGGNPIAQADHFLNTVKPDANTLLSLDFESNPNGDSMSLAEAEQFVQYLHIKTGRWPLLYTGSWYVNTFINAHQTTALSNCPLWVASYLETPTFPVQWPSWTLWQYTNGVNGPEPHTVSGILKCDRSKFNGTLQQLQQLWGG